MITPHKKNKKITKLKINNLMSKDKIEKKNSSKPKLTRLTCDKKYEIGITLKKNHKAHKPQ
jgi:hypothetical protein